MYTIPKVLVQTAFLTHRTGKPSARTTKMVRGLGMAVELGMVKPTFFFPEVVLEVLGVFGGLPFGHYNLW